MHVYKAQWWTHLPNFTQVLFFQPLLFIRSDFSSYFHKSPFPSSIPLLEFLACLLTSVPSLLAAFFLHSSLPFVLVPEALFPLPSFPSSLFRRTDLNQRGNSRNARVPSWQGRSSALHLPRLWGTGAECVAKQRDEVKTVFSLVWGKE